MEIGARELLKRGKSIMKPCAEEAYYLLGPRGKYWLKEILATSKEWQTFQTTCHAWLPQNKYTYVRWESELEHAAYDWEKLQVVQVWTCLLQFTFTGGSPNSMVVTNKIVYRFAVLS